MAVVYLQTHWDREWYQPFRMYQVRLADVVDAILDRVDSGVLPNFMLDGQTVLLDDYLELRPERRAQLERLIRVGKLRIGPWYVMPDEFLVGGESLIRNLKRGILSSRVYGQVGQFCGYLPDTFGHSADMPTILSQFGIGNALVWRGVSPRHSEFWWQSPSGEKVFSYFLADGYFQMMMHMPDDDVDFGEGGKQGALLRLSKKLSDRAYGHDYLLPIGGDHLGPLGVKEMAQLRMFLPDLRIETPETLLSRLEETCGDYVETIDGELTNNDEAFLLPGVYSARPYLKQANRNLEHALTRRWEPLQAMVGALSGKTMYAQELDIAWKNLLLNHPHDSICGCSVDEVHQHNEVRFEQTNSLYQASVNRLANYLASSVSTPEHWLAVNTGAKSYQGVVSVTVDKPFDFEQPDYFEQPIAGMQVEHSSVQLLDEHLSDFMQVPLSHKRVRRYTGWVWADNIPALGFSNLSKQSLASPGNAFAKFSNDTLIENDHCRVSVQKDGTLTITDKQSGETFEQMLQWRDIVQQGDSYNAAPVVEEPIIYGEFHRIIPWQDGPLVAGFIVEHRVDVDLIQTKVWLEAGSPLVQFESTFTNTKYDHLLQVGFQTKAPISEVLAESHFSTVTRAYDPDYRIEQHVPVAAWKELKTNTGPIQRFVTVNNQVLMTDGIAEYDVVGDTVYLSVLRSFAAISAGDTGVRGAQAGPPFLTPQGQCINRTHRLRYAWAPRGNRSEADIAAVASRFYGDVFTVPGKGQSLGQPRSLISWGNPDVDYTACYRNVSGGLTLRLLNRSAEEQSVRLKTEAGYQCWQESNALDEACTERFSLQDDITLTPYALKTILLSP